MFLSDNNFEFIDEMIDETFGCIMSDYFIKNLEWVDDSKERLFAIMQDSKGQVSKLICLFPPLPSNLV